MCKFTHLYWGLNDVVSLKPYLSRSKYKLFACFYEASMVFDVDGPIEFEVSIGKNFIIFVLGNPIKWTKVNWLYDGGMQQNL